MKPLLTFLTLAAALHANADVKLPAIFSSHMMVQRDVPFHVWGWADAGEKVSASFAGQTAEATADASGKWSLTFAPVSKGEALSLSVTAKNSVQLDDLIVGDVWICSGQSNMGMKVSESKDAKAEIAEATYPNIRLFSVMQATSEKKLDDLKGQWLICSPQSIGGFSAVGYFFGRDVHKATGVPIGLLQSSWGGTPVEAWTDLDQLRAQKSLQPMFEAFDKHDLAQRQAEYQSRITAWATLINEKIDPTNEGESRGFGGIDFDDSAWKTMPVPGAWENTIKLEFDGVMWLRKEVTLPESWKDKELRLNLGAIDDWDKSYFNGAPVGEMKPSTTGSAYNKQRAYTVAKDLVRPGRNLIAVRILDAGLPGGMLGPEERLSIAPADGSGTPISLAGDWKYAIEKTINAKAIPPQPIPPRPEIEPAQLYNAMIHPIIPFPIKGTIWYQGENNAPHAYQYRTLLPTMINNWRSAWKLGDFPFLIVQLANFSSDWTDPGESHAWAELREAQYLTSKKLPNCELAVAIDVGDAQDIHPKDKQSVGHRLALQALRTVYGQEVVASGPEYKSMEINGNKIILHFNNSAGLKSSAPAPGAFAIAGEDKSFKWAQAKIVGELVEVWSDEISDPVAVRYAWGSNPVATLYNGAGLPAIPFRTDDWPMSTEKNK
jgi:sialate O-acetylesterase